MRSVAMVSAGVSACALALIAAPAAARDGAWYVGGDFGGMIVEDTDIEIGTTEDAVVLDHDFGFDGALFVGYDLGAFRIDAEVAYKHAGLGEFENTILIPSSSGDHPVGTHEAFGSTSALSFMLNGMLDFGDDDGLSGFVGAGAGVARVEFNALRPFENTGEFLDDGDSQFAWQVFAGVRQAVSDNIDVTVRYRFFNVTGLELEGFGEDPMRAPFRSHSLLGGITFNFGAPQ